MPVSARQMWLRMVGAPATVVSTAITWAGVGNATVAPPRRLGSGWHTIFWFVPSSTGKRDTRLAGLCRTTGVCDLWMIFSDALGAVVAFGQPSGVGERR